jgi:hypothetical protein
LAQNYKNTKISHTSTAQFEGEKENDFVDKRKIQSHKRER